MSEAHDPIEEPDREAEIRATGVRTDEISLDATIEAALLTIDDVAAVEANPLGTVSPKLSEASRRALAELRDQGGEAFDVRGTLGEGGMGIVHVAQQRSLGREVAIKTLRPELAREELVLKVLQEAWVTGTLEHPNVVPVYDIVTDTDGRPRIVLKKIEGLPWSELMHDEAAIRKKFRAGDVLDWNLGIVLEVCQALRFAHARGFVHRDLKPENVMVGEFGEVYLLDWGIAVALEDDGSGRFPLARDATQVAGTPCYMAPEQLGGEESAISPRTDVYLVGSLLYELLVGRPPHQGDNLHAILASVLRSPPGIPDHVSTELARIVRRAMDGDPDARFETIEQLRLAIEGYLRHRESRRIAKKADERARALADAVRLAEEERAEALFAECSFGYKAALEAWPENETARRRLAAITAQMIDFQLTLGDVVTASRLFAQMDGPTDALRARVRAAQADAEKRRKTLEALGRDEDRSIGKRTRSFLTLVLGVIWTSAPLVAEEIGVMRDHPHETIAIASGAFIVIFAALVLWARESMFGSRVNRTVVGMVFALFFAQLVYVAGAMLMGLSEGHTRAMLMMLWCFGTMIGTVVIEGWFVVPTIVFAGGFLVSCVRPGWAVWAMSITNGVFIVVALLTNQFLRDPPEHRSLRPHGRRSPSGDA